MLEVKKLEDQLNQSVELISKMMLETYRLSKTQDVQYSISSLGGAIQFIEEFQREIYTQYPELLPPHKIIKDDPELTDEQRLLCNNLSASELVLIDDSLLSYATKNFRKVAMIVSQAMKVNINDKPVPDIFYAERIKILVSSGKLESQGNLNKMRYSEVRLPLTQRSKAMISNPVVHFEIYVENMMRAKTFYESVLGIKLENMQSPVPEMDIEMWFFPMDKDSGMQQYGSGGALVKTSAYTPAGNGGTVVYFSCDDCAVQITRTTQYGGSVFQDKMAIGEHGFCALAKDTEGNLIGFHSMK